MATQVLADWVFNLQPNSIPPSVYCAAQRSFYNWVGCAIGGSTHPTIIKASLALQPFLTTDTTISTSTLLGPNRRGSFERTKTDPQHAALINGIASHVHDYDDTHLDTIIHPTGPVASALLAYAEYASCRSEDDDGSQSTDDSKPGSVSGRTFLTALIAGIEAECLLGLSVWPTHYDIGWHITSTVGSIGAAVAVSKVMQLTAEQTRHAIGIAAAQVTGLREMFGSDTKAFHVGRAAQNGLLAAILAQGGFTASDGALEGKRGWVSVVGNGTNRLDEMLQRLGKGDEHSRWEMEKNAFKPFPCGIVVHPVIDACVQLHDELTTNRKVDVVKEVMKVCVKVHPLVLELTGKKEPVDGLQAKFSVYHGGAVGMVLGKARPEEYERSVVLDERVVSVRSRIEAEVDKSLAPDEAFVTIKMNDGLEVQKHIRHAVGSLERPMTDQQLEQKFIDQVKLVMGDEKAKEISRMCWALNEMKDIREIGKACQS